MTKYTILSDADEAYAVAVVRTGSQTKAYHEVFNSDGLLSKHAVSRDVMRLRQRPDINQRIQELRAAIEEALSQARGVQVAGLVYDKLSVFQHWQDIVLADVSKVVQHRRVCCRHCHGKGHHYQWLDAKEFADALAEAIDLNAMRQRMKPPKKPLDLPTDAGGYDFRFNLKPHADCPRCLGEGKSDVLMMDTSQLEQRERRLIKSIKAKPSGEIEIVFHDQMEALGNMAKALGMLTEKIQLTDNSKPDVPALPLDPVEASRVYAEWVKG